MPTKRTPLNRRARRRINSADMLEKVQRVVELLDAHTAALTGLPGDHSFYSDGRHRELVDLLPQVTIPLDIEPWEDARAILGDLLAQAGSIGSLRVSP